MQLVNGFKLMKYAKESGLLLPAFNATNYEVTKGIIDGFEAMNLGNTV